MTELNADNGSLVQTISGGNYRFNGPSAIAYDGTHVWVANGVSNDVSVIDVANQRVIKSIQVGELPWGVAFGPN